MVPQIQSVDARVAPEELLREMWEYYKAVYAEELPGDPVVPFRRQALDWRNYRDDHARDRWLMRDENDEIVAVGSSFRDLAQNLENGSFWVHVREDRRGNGLGRRLATHILQVCEADQRSRIDTYTSDGAIAEDWLERLGLQK
ncbi:MAG: GNAT family N-acetyltransferase, partial [Acidimicrobiia bacterium]